MADGPGGRFFLVVGLMLVLAAGAARAAEPQPVRIGIYAFAPFVKMEADGSARGYLPALVEDLNRIQDRWAFELVPTTPVRRYRDFNDGRFDVMLLENPDWGWRQRSMSVDITAPVLTAGETYIALAGEDRDQTVFDRVGERSLAAYLGYHYRFADFVSDPEALRERFDIRLVNDQEAIIGLVLAGRVEVGVVAYPYIYQYLNNNPDAAARLMVSETPDTSFELPALVRSGGTPTADDLNRLFDTLRRLGDLERLSREHGLIE